jgi:hypothetical protein
MEEKWETFPVKKLLEIGLNYVHEATHSLYVKHVYNVAVVDTLLVYDTTIKVEERVDTVVKRVPKLTATSKAAVGQPGRGGITSGNYSGDMQ